MSDIMQKIKETMDSNQLAMERNRQQVSQLEINAVLARPTVQRLAEAHQRKHPTLSIGECRLAVVKTDEGRAAYNLADLASRIGRVEAARRTVERESRERLTPVVAAAAAEAQFETLWKSHQSKHGGTDREARLAVVKTPGGRQLYNAIDRARSRESTLVED